MYMQIMISKYFYNENVFDRPASSIKSAFWKYVEILNNSTISEWKPSFYLPFKICRVKTSVFELKYASLNKQGYIEKN